MNKIDLLEAMIQLSVSELYYDNKNQKKAESLKIMVSELESVLLEMEEHNRQNAKLTILPWDED